MPHVVILAASSHAAHALLTYSRSDARHARAARPVFKASGRAWKGEERTGNPPHSWCFPNFP
eukprot:4623307-Pleurochrysis_carterae.AAC.1